MVASRTTPATIDLSAFDEPLADALRDALGADQPVHLTDAGRPLAQITPLHPTEALVEVDVSPVDVEPIDAEEKENDEGRRLLAKAWETRRSFTEPYVFDQIEHDRLTEERHRLAEELGTVFPPGTDAVELIREQRRGHWER